MYHCSACVLHLCLLCGYVRAQILSFGFISSAIGAGVSGNQIRTTLHWNNTLYQCFLEPGLTDIWYYCQTTSSRCATAATTEYKMYLDILGADGLTIGAVSVIQTTTNSTWTEFCSSLSFPFSIVTGTCTDWSGING